MAKLDVSDVKQYACGNWLTVFSNFGINISKKNAHGPCPFCGGTDRFRFDDKYECGDWICNVCTESKSHDGFELIQKVTGMPFREVLEGVASAVGMQVETQITEQQRKEWAIQAKIRHKEAAERERKKQEQVARQAQGLYRNPYPGESSPYLERKQVPALSGAKIDYHGNVLIPAFDAEGYQWNMQTIYADGGKFFTADKEDPTGNKKGGRTGGCFFLIGTVELTDQVICIAEGYATGASIHLATNLPVFIAFVANNLDKVGIEIRKMYPSAKLVYCADDDSAKDSTGLKYAEKAVAVTGGIVVLPKFNQVA